MPDFVKIANVRKGQHLRADSGFTCLRGGQLVAVREDGDGFYVPCHNGRHYLDGQADDKDEVYIGFYPVK